jgi:hypothetical protein
MPRSVASKVMWVGRATVFLVGLAVILALVLGLASTAFGSNGMAFLLGRSNLATGVRTLVKQGPGPALSLQVDSGPPMAVDSSTRVTDLNADRLDGKSGTDFYAAGSKVADSSHADQADSATSAGDANTFDGKDSTRFADSSHTHSGADIASGTVEADRIEDGQGSNLNADQLDGLDSTQLPHGFYQVDQIFTQASPANGAAAARVLCDEGDQVVGGGYESLDQTSKLATDTPDFDDDAGQSGWVIAWRTPDPSTTDSILVHALCADFGDTHQ